MSQKVLSSLARSPRIISTSFGSHGRLSASLVSSSRLYSTSHLSKNEVNSEGHATRKPGQGLDVQSASVKQGQRQAEVGKTQPGGPYDTAHEDKGGARAESSAKREAIQNADTINQAAFAAGSFKDHRADQQRTPGTPAGEVGGEKEARPSTVTATIKQALGFETTKGEHQVSRSGFDGRKQKYQFHTSARTLAPAVDAEISPGDATNAAPRDGEGARKPVDDKVLGDQSPHLKHREAKSQGERASAGGRAKYHTSARSAGKHGSNEQAAGGYAKSYKPAGTRDGADVPSEPLPSPKLNVRPGTAPENLTPSSNMGHSSTSSGPRHEANAQAALDGTLADRNPQPSAKEGEGGLGEGWKSRDAEIKSGKPKF